MSDERDWRGRRSLHGDRASNPADGDHPTERLTGLPGASDDADSPTTDIFRDGSDPGGPGVPFDMTDVHIDDQFVEALSQNHSVPTRDDAEYALAELLSGWRHEVIATPAPPLPTIEEVEAAIAATARANRPRRITRHLRVASGVAAVVVVAVAGLTVLSEGSQPGDPLWGVKSVVFASAASETQASVNVQSNLEKAEAAISAGDTTEAQSLVAQAERELGPVRDAGTRDRMNQWITRLRADVTTASSKPAVTSAPPENSVTTTDETGQQNPARDRMLRSSQPDSGASTPPPSDSSESSSPVPPPPPPSAGGGEPSQVPPIVDSSTTPAPASATNPSQGLPNPAGQPDMESWTTTTPVWPN